ncbi:TonB-dependent receptor domain-containing protein [Derxia gummosa]|uniref:TonB-dependent receptor domain-containing protein n=1 Tax=Derxia gummosa DSM 723 TaxID=1121388 RepID=A0A8B6X4Q3_9BURK|nr:TonB-dependent receptor [Derxia gummosa]
MSPHLSCPAQFPALLPRVLALSVALACAAANAETATDEVRLDPVTVTAERGSDTNTVVRAKRIELEQATSIQELFKQMPEVSVGGGGGLPVAQKVYVRGINERMLATTIDGATQPEAPYHHTGQLLLDPDLIKRLEVEAGTGAATAGPGALAGALRVTTKSAADLLRPGERAGAILKAGWQSVNDGRKFAATVFGAPVDGLDVVANLSKLKTSEYKDGNGSEVPNTASDVEHEFVKFGLGGKGEHRAALSYEHYEDEGIRSQRTNMLPIPINPAQRQRAKRESVVANYDWVPGNDLLRVHATAYFNDNSVAIAQDKPTPETMGVRSTGFNLDNVSKFGMHKLTTGLNWRRDTGYLYATDENWKDESASVAGLFAQDDIALADAWQAQIGLRWDRYRYTDIESRDFGSSGFSPSGSLVWSPLDSLDLRLSHARALRGVGVIEPYLKAFQTNAANLEAEKARNTELSARWHDAGWAATAGVFRQRIDNYIGYDDARQNLGDVRVTGANASLGYTAADWSASAGVSQARPTLNGTPLSDGDAFLLGSATGRTWVAQFDQNLPRWNARAGLTGRAVGRLTRVPDGNPQKAGYVLLDAYAQWLPTGRDDWSITLTVKNLLDHFHYDQTTYGYNPRWGSIAGLPEPGRDVRVTLAWRL